MSDPSSLKFIDCNAFIGRPTVRSHWQPAAAADLVREMDRAGIARSLVWHIAQHDASPLLGNDLLCEAIAPHRDRFIPCWSILPAQAGELGDLDAWFERAGAAGVKAFRAWPARGRYLLRRETVGNIIAMMTERRIPLIYTLSSEADWRDIYDLLRDFPDLRVILNYTSCWSGDRYFRPIVEACSHVCVEISAYFPPGGIESFVKTYGPWHLLFGTGFPTAYHGAMMLMVAHADIPFEAKQAIASGNIERLLKEVKL